MNLQRLPLWIAALWWGSLTTVGFFVVPLLFAHLPTPALAGGMAARLFTAQTWVTLVCGMAFLMLLGRKKATAPVKHAHTATIFIVGGMLLALLSEFAITPKIIARDNLRLWHGIGGGMYLLQWLCASVTFWHIASDSNRLP